MDKKTYDYDIWSPVYGSNRYAVRPPSHIEEATGSKTFLKALLVLYLSYWCFYAVKSFDVSGSSGGSHPNGELAVVLEAIRVRDSVDGPASSRTSTSVDVSHFSSGVSVTGSGVEEKCLPSKLLGILKRRRISGLSFCLEFWKDISGAFFPLHAFEFLSCKSQKLGCT